MTYPSVNTLDFTGDGITFLGFIGVISTLLITVVAFRRFYSSPYNVRVTSKKTEEKKFDHLPMDEC